MLKSLTQKFLILALLILGGYLLYLVGQTAYKHYAFQLQINIAKEEVAQLQKASEDVKKLLAQLGSKEFLTLRLKEELSLKEPDEKVVIVKDAKSQTALEKEEEKKEKPFWHKWWEIFFGIN